jgi:antitoxin (DNA-binding transcriptional repressor) of toxin-antitoxin stability system
METVKIGVREFRENLSDYLESGKPLAITRHGETLGFYIPAQKRSRAAKLEAMRAAAKDLDEMIATWGMTEDELMEDYKEIRQSAREKKRDAKPRASLPRNKKPSKEALQLPIGERAEIAFKVAVAKAIDENARLGIPNHIWRDGRVVELPPEEVLKRRS